MATSTEKIICPYCMTEHVKSTILGVSGLISISGTTRNMTCKLCGEWFEVIVDVTIKFKTKK